MAKQISAQIVADSVNIQGDRITTYVLTYPRMIHAEVMTHRMFSRNAASSRAIPFERMVKMVEEDPFIPIAWQKDHKGMQGTEYFVEGEHEYGIFHKSMHDDSSYYDNHETWFKSEEERDKTFEYWGKNDNGPGPNYWHRNSKKISRPLHYTFKEDWLRARDTAVKEAKKLAKLGITKQLCNRLLEPFMWHTVLVTATSYENFFELRCPKYEIYAGPEDIPEYFCSGRSWKEFMKSNNGLAGDFNTENIVERLQYSKSGAEIHIQALAEAMFDAMNESTPRRLEAGMWHYPFHENMPFKVSLEDAIKISVARAARLSYMTFDGEIDYEKDIKLHDQLLASKHASPFEHICRALTNEEYESCGKIILLENGTFEFQKGWVDNFRGYKSYRRILNFS